MTDPNEPVGAQQNASAPAQAESQKTSVLAVVGLILGVLSLFLWVLSALPGLICSLAALVKIKRSNGRLGGRGIAIAGLTASICFVFLHGMLFSPLITCNDSYLRIRQTSKNNMHLIGKACYMYSSTNGFGQPPASLQDLFRVNLIDDERIIVNPQTQRKDYTFLPYTKDAPAKRIILVEGPGSYETDICVLFLDGVVVPLKISGTAEQTRFVQALIKGDTALLLEFRKRLGLPFYIPGENANR